MTNTYAPNAERLTPEAYLPRLFSLKMHWELNICLHYKLIYIYKFVAYGIVFKKTDRPATSGDRRIRHYPQKNTYRRRAHRIGYWRNHRGRYFCPHGERRRRSCRICSYSFICDCRDRVRIGGTSLCRICGYDSYSRKRIHLYVYNYGRISGLDHRVGPRSGICPRRRNRIYRLVAIPDRTHAKSFYRGNSLPVVAFSIDGFPIGCTWYHKSACCCNSSHYDPATDQGNAE